MTKIAWREEMSVGVDKVDEQHKKLLEIIADLHEAVETEHGGAVAEALFQETSDYVANHFSTEEELMNEHAYPKFEEHLKMHDWFIKQVMELHKNKNEETAKKTLTFLTDWFINHIMKTDKEMGSFLVKVI
jgi:hemerythrin